jgi:cytochrome c5
MLKPKRIAKLLVVSAAAAAIVFIAGVIVNGSRAAFSAAASPPSRDASERTSANALFLQGRKIFRYDTFGDQSFWGGALKLNKAIAGAKLGGIGGGVSPKTALALGLKVDSAALPATIVSAIKAGKVDLASPATTLALLKLNAVVGVKGFFDKGGRLTSLGTTCALCHSTVDDSFAPGIGKRLDGWPNRDLNVGAIVGAAPDHSAITGLLGIDEATLGKVLSSWGPGRFDAEVFLDGKAFRPDGKTGAVLIPAAYGLAGVNLATYTGWGTVTYWNAFVANLEMHGQGNFHDARLDDAAKFPVAARSKFGHTTHNPDQVSRALPALQYYQLALKAPKPRAGSYDKAAAARGRAVFDGQGRCSSCHMAPTYSEPGYNLHTPSEICVDNFTSNRSPTGMYRTTPLRGVSTRKGGYYHDGRFPTLGAVVDHYNSCLNLGLTAGQQGDLVQFLKSR